MSKMEETSVMGCVCVFKLDVEEKIDKNDKVSSVEMQSTRSSE